VNEPADEDERWISDLFHTVDTMPVPPRDPVRIERRIRRATRTPRLLAAAAVIAVALASGAFAVSATRHDPQTVRTGSSGGAAPSDPAPSPRGPAATGQPADDTVAGRGQNDPTRKDVQAVYDKMLDCLAHSGVVVTDSSISISKYDVHDTLDYDGARSEVEGGDLQRAVAMCRADLEAVSEAWTEAAGPYPTDEVNAAVRECLDAEPGPALSIADAQSHAGELYGKCMSEAHHQVFGTEP
jgi:hypothetical protein